LRQTIDAEIGVDRYAVSLHEPAKGWANLRINRIIRRRRL
jgi:hypothetical protein